MFVPLSPLRCLSRAAELYGRKEGVVSGGLRFTYSQFAERCGRLGGALAASGVQPLDRVGYLSFNTHQLLEGYFGVLQAGAIVMPLNVRLTPSELTVILNHSGARFLLYESDFAPLIPHFQKECPGIAKYQALDNSYEEFLARGVMASLDIHSIDENSTAELFYTSGSTGFPKGVALSHRTLYLHALSVAATLHQDDTAVELHTIPLFHANGWGRPQATTLMGGRHVMVRRFEPATVFRLIENERATSMSLVPTMANALLNAPDLAAHDYSSLREIHLGGAAASPELIERLEKAFHCSCMAGYGLTETAPVATSARRKSTVVYGDETSRLRHLSMAGWPLPGVSIRVVDDAMRDVPRDMLAIGEVIVSGDHVMDGYFHEPEATASVMTGGWFHTGDMAIWDEENYVHIVDRKKDIIISGGENISSIEVELAISAHPEVLECTVVSAPDEKWGEVPVAIVVVRSGTFLSKEILCKFLTEKLARFKMPHRFEFQSEPLPKTGTGKIMKRELRERFWSGKSDRVQG
jgi:fatty-acyl-CoA synthase